MPRTIPVTSFRSYILTALALGLVVATAIPAAAQVVVVPSPPIPSNISGVGPYYALPSWDQSLPASTRFLVLSNMGQQAVLDRDTGLVWERTPARETHEVSYEALLACLALNVGGRRGWRLPSAPELMSLMGREVHLLSVALPTGHPFDTSNITALGQPQRYFWTTTLLADYEAVNDARYFAFVQPSGRVHKGRVTYNRFSEPAPIWCVRGPGSSY